MLCIPFREFLGGTQSSRDVQVSEGTHCTLFSSKPLSLIVALFTRGFPRSLQPPEFSQRNLDCGPFKVFDKLTMLLNS